MADGIVVALGTIIACRDDKDEVFGAELGDDNYCVSVDIVVHGDVDIPLELRNEKLKVDDVFIQQAPSPKELVHLNDN